MEPKFDGRGPQCQGRSNRKRHDAPNESYTGYFKVARLGEDKVTTIVSKGTTNEHAIYDTSQVSPNFRTTPMISTQGTIAIAIIDAEVASPVRTIRPWEALSLYGFTKEERRRMLFDDKLSWSKTKEEMKSMAPQQVWQQIFTYSLCRSIQKEELSTRKARQFLTKRIDTEDNSRQDKTHQWDTSKPCSPSFGDRKNY
jgi:hypothetical protein